MRSAANFPDSSKVCLLHVICNQRSVDLTSFKQTDVHRSTRTTLCALVVRNKDAGASPVLIDTCIGTVKSGSGVPCVQAQVSIVSMSLKDRRSTNRTQLSKLHIPGQQQPSDALLCLAGRSKIPTTRPTYKWPLIACSVRAAVRPSFRTDTGR